MKYAVYRYFDRKGALLYVGCSDHPMIRLHSGRLGRSWIYGVKTVTLTWYREKLEALWAERKAIKQENPFYNKQYMDERKGALKADKAK